MDRKQSSQVTLGVFLVLFGLAVLVRQMDVPWDIDFRRLWPVVFFLLAVGHLATTDGRPHLSTVAWFLFLGTIFLLHTYRVLPLSRSWPLFVVAGGVSLLMEPILCQLGRGRAKGSN